MPIVKFEGRTATGNPRVDAMSRAIVTTAHLSPLGQQFLKELQETFAGGPKPKKEPTTNVS